MSEPEVRGKGGSGREGGRGGGPRGVTGQIRVKPYSNDPSGLVAVRTVRLSAKGGGEANRASSARTSPPGTLRKTG